MTVCKVENCDEPVFQRERCRVDYMRWYRHGDDIPTCGRCGEPTGKITFVAKYCEPCRKFILRDSWLRNERNRRAIKRGLPVEDFTRDDVTRLDNNTCYLCCGTIDPEDLQLDHIIPLTRPGSSGMMWNIAATHRRCNQRKNNRSVEAIAHLFPNLKLPERYASHDANTSKA